MSVDPPGVNGTTMCTGFAGQSMPAPSAREEMMDGAARLEAASAMRRRRLSMNLSRRWLCPMASGSCCWGASLESRLVEINATKAAVPPLLFEHDLFRKPVSTFRDHALLRVFLFAVAGRNGVGAGEPAVQVDVLAAIGTERLGSRNRWLAAD